MMHACWACSSTQKSGALAPNTSVGTTTTKCACPSACLANWLRRFSPRRPQGPAAVRSPAGASHDLLQQQPQRQHEPKGNVPPRGVDLQRLDGLGLCRKAGRQAGGDLQHAPMGSSLLQGSSIPLQNHAAPPGTAQHSSCARRSKRACGHPSRGAQASKQADRAGPPSVTPGRGAQERGQTGPRLTRPVRLCQLDHLVGQAIGDHDAGPAGQREHPENRHAQRQRMGQPHAELEHLSTWVGQAGGRPGSARGPARGCS